MEFDPERFRLRDPAARPVLRARQPRLPQHAAREAYLGGPIPFRWLQPAAKLPGKTFLVAVLLWHRVQVQRCRTAIRTSRALFEAFGVSRQAAYRAYSALERAGLISVIREAGKRPRVVILDVPEGS